MLSVTEDPTILGKSDFLKFPYVAVNVVLMVALNY